MGAWAFVAGGAGRGWLTNAHLTHFIFAHQTKLREHHHLLLVKLAIYPICLDEPDFIDLQQYLEEPCQTIMKRVFLL
jgi:hypothetical protein